MVVPYKTKCYSETQDPAEAEIPLCTLKQFPNLIEHCIEWSRDRFNLLFTDRAQDAISFLEDKTSFMKNMEKNHNSGGQIEILQQIKELIDLKKNPNYNNCVKISRNYFDAFFNHNIRDLLWALPADKKDDSGNPFWSGPKRPPSPMEFDSNDETHLLFVLTCANLVAFTLGVPQEQSFEKVKEIVDQIQGLTYKHKSVVIEDDKKKEGEKKEPVIAAPEDKELICALLGDLDLDAKAVSPKDILPAEFEKDDDTNFHIDFIHATS